MHRKWKNDLSDFNVTSKLLKVFEFCNTLPIVTYNAVPYHEFFEKYIIANQACLIKNVAQDWESYQLWTKEGKPNMQHLVEKYGHCMVTKYDCNRQYYNSQEAGECLFNEYIIYWQEFNLHKTDKLLYLKDWHLKNQRPNDNFYEVPLYFTSDWLNEYLCAKNKDDYRFVYMGPKKTWTPFHADVFKSFSWSVNICGLKRWVLLHPGEELKLNDQFGHLPFDISNTYQNLRHYEIFQGPGEAVFVPSGWYHQVWNVEDTISINHNWINGCNIKYVYDALCDNLKEVENEISDCKDMTDFDQQCQLILKSTFGMDYQDFIAFVIFIFDKRMQMVHDKMIGHNQVLFDLNCIKDVLGKIRNSVYNNDSIIYALDKMENIF